MLQLHCLCNITIAINAKTYLPEYLVADVTDLMNSVTKATEGYSIKDCSLDATFVSYNSDVNVYSTSSATITVIISMVIQHRIIY